MLQDSLARIFLLEKIIEKVRTEQDNGQLDES